MPQRYVLQAGSAVPTLERGAANEFVLAQDEVIVRLTAVALNGIDQKTLSSAWPLPRPFVPGVDFAGLVAAAGSDVKGLPIGSPVFGCSPLANQGAWQSEIKVPASLVAQAPKLMKPRELATLPFGALNALQAMKEADLMSGTGGEVLVVGGGTEIGQVAIQIFARSNLNVTATVHLGEKGYLQYLGAKNVVDPAAFESTAQDMDLVFDTVGGDLLRRAISTAKAGGAVVSTAGEPCVGQLRKAGFSIGFFDSMRRYFTDDGISKTARSASVKYIPQLISPDAELMSSMERFFGAVSRGDPIKTRIEKLFPFNKLPEALEYHRTQNPRGRVVVTLSPHAFQPTN